MWAFLVASWPGVLEVQGFDGRGEAPGLGELVGAGESAAERLGPRLVPHRRLQQFGRPRLRQRVVPYSIQWLKRLKPALFRQDLIALFDLLQQQKIKPLIAQRFPLAEARQAHELLGKGGVTGKIVLVRNGSSLESGAA
jgi:NADPH:quinone reductase-like Zn-dependent oxidoreductase